MEYRDTFTIKFPTLNYYMGLNRNQMIKFKKQYEHQLMCQMFANKPFPRFKNPVEIEVKFFNYAADVDNIQAVFYKVFLDCVKSTSMLMDDNPRYVKALHTYTEEDNTGTERIEVRIYEREDVL